jgi:hypothetical protein
VPAETQHAHVHRAAAADDRHVGRHVTVNERAASLDDRSLLVDRQAPIEMECAGRDLHSRTLPFHGRAGRVSRER